MELLINNKVIDTPIVDILYLLRSQTGNRLFKHIQNKGDNVQCTCPNHKEGQERKPSCSIYNTTSGDTEYGWVHCFTCGYNVPLYRMVADVFNKDEAFGKAWLIDNFGNTLVSETQLLDAIVLNKFNKNAYLDESILEQYKYHTNYWATRHISEEVVKKFELGYDPSTDMVVFPIRDAQGHLSMLTKRSVQTKFFQIEENKEKPVYLLYYCIRNNCSKVVVCESQINALTCWSWGIPAIALIGTGSESQYKLLRRSGIRNYVLAFDGDTAGKIGTNRFIKNMSNDVLISVKKIPLGKDVNDLTKEQFESLPEEII